MEITGTAMNYAVQGMNKAVNLMNRTADNIANERGELATEMTNQIVAEKTLTANTKTVKTYDEMMGELVRLGDQRKR